MEIIIAIASKIGQYLVKPIGREFGYLFNYHSNLESLQAETKKLFDKKNGVQGLVDAAKRNGLIIKPDVQSWLQNVNDDMVKKVLQFEVEINKRCVCQWSLSRKAYKIKQEVLQLQNEGTFENVAHPTPPPAIWSTFEKGFKDFQSRKANMNEVIEGLKREEVRMIGICGMGGVGKTTMVKEIMTRLAKLNLFDKIVMATVSQSPSIRTIQSEIADEIGLQFKVLSINIPSVIHLFPKDIVLKSPTIRFAICFDTWGGRISEMSTYAFENCLEISKSDARELESQAVRLLLKKSKKLYLHNVKNLSVLTDLDHEVFQDLNDLRLVDCPNTEYLANGTSATQLPDSFLTNLRFLQLGSCRVLKYVFSLSIARNLVQLQELNIGGCNQMEEIVSKQGREHEEEADMISFHKLTKLYLWDLRSLVNFFQAKKLYSNQEETTAGVEHQSAGIFEKAIFPSKCIS